MTKDERFRYYASREWAVLKEAVRERSGGKCERCLVAEHEETHHVTYERMGWELPEDLQGVCGPCHEFLSGKSAEDPAAGLVAFTGLPRLSRDTDGVIRIMDREFNARIRNAERDGRDHTLLELMNLKRDIKRGVILEIIEK